MPSSRCRTRSRRVSYFSPRSPTFRTLDRDSAAQTSSVGSTTPSPHAPHPCRLHTYPNPHAPHPCGLHTHTNPHTHQPSHTPTHTHTNPHTRQPSHTPTLAHTNPRTHQPHQPITPTPPALPSTAPHNDRCGRHSCEQRSQSSSRTAASSPIDTARGSSRRCGLGARPRAAASASRSRARIRSPSCCRSSAPSPTFHGLLSPSPTFRAAGHLPLPQAAAHGDQ